MNLITVKEAKREIKVHVVIGGYMVYLSYGEWFTYRINWF